MTRGPKIGAAVAALMLGGGCTAQQLQQSAATVQQACVTVGPTLAAGAASRNPQAQSIASFGNAVCGPVAAGSVPATVDSNTPTWLGSLAGMLKVIVPIAARAL